MTRIYRSRKILKEIILENGDFLVLTEEIIEQNSKEIIPEPRSIYRLKKIKNLFGE